MAKQLDLITIGRSSVDLYGSQVGGRLEDMASFRKYIGGSPTNIAAGAARLGLRSAVITRVGDEHMGRFIREQLEREGVDVRGVKTDPERLTALVILGIRNDQDFPLIFYRENCADMALSVEDIDPEFIKASRCVCPTGTHLSHPDTCSAVLKALDIARRAGIRTALDIDYRPNLWGLAGHDAGESRYIASERVTETLQAVLDKFDLIVGTEEEFHIAGGSQDTIEALRAVRQLTAATLVCKRGPMGASAFEGGIPDSLDDGVAGRGFAVEVFNVLGAGDGFMAGLLDGWLTGKGWATALEQANACGAFAVSRHGCAPSYPSREELNLFLERGVKTPALRKDAELEQIHWSTVQKSRWPFLRLMSLEEQPLPTGQADDELPERFKALCLDAIRLVSRHRTGCGMIFGAGTDRQLLMDATGTGLWVGCIANPGAGDRQSFDDTIGYDFGGLSEWPVGRVAIARFEATADPDLHDRRQRNEILRMLHTATRRNGLELLVGLNSSLGGDAGEQAYVKAITGIYELGVYPDGWLIEPQSSTEEWAAICETVTSHDKYCRTVIVDGTKLDGDTIAETVSLASDLQPFGGVVVGRRSLGSIPSAWQSGLLDDQNTTERVAEVLEGLIEADEELR